MTSSLERELSDIFEKVYPLIEKENISLRETYDLYFKAKNKYLSAKEEEKTEEAGQLMLGIFFRTGKISEEFVAKWQSGKFVPTEKELGLLKKGCEEVLVAFDDYFKPNLLELQGKPYKFHHAEVKEKIKKIKGLIKKHEAKLARM